MKTKKIFLIVMAAVLAMALAACGSTQNSSQQSGSSAGSSSDSSSSAFTGSSSVDETASGGTSGGKALVVYFSASGSTKDVAEKIAKATGADTFEITPSQPYTDDDLNWTDENSRVNKEHEDESLQDQVQLSSTDVPDWDSYDTVFFGYPIWWGNAAWPVRGFVKANDFTGKTVIPFCTSSSSDIGDSGTDLGKLAGTGNWQKGMRFSGSASDSEVNEWVQGLDLE